MDEPMSSALERGTKYSHRTIPVMYTGEMRAVEVNRLEPSFDVRGSFLDTHENRRSRMNTMSK